MDNLGECLVEEKGETERRNTFDPNNLPFTKIEKDEVKGCLDAEKKAETCSHCRWKCGRAMKKGIKYYYSFT
jgi:hypothetical protein